MSKNLKVNLWPPFRRQGTTITQRTAGDSVNLGGAVLAGYSDSLIPSTGAVSVLTTDTGKVYYNAAATDLSLPVIADGLHYKFVVAHNSYLKVIAAGSTTIRYQADVSAAGGYWRSDTVGNTMEIVAINGVWFIHSLEGAWSCDS
jgi:hypothetical protein